MPIDILVDNTQVAGLPNIMSVQSASVPLLFVGRSVEDFITGGIINKNVIKSLLTNPNELNYRVRIIGSLEYGANLSLDTNLSPYPGPGYGFVPGNQILRNGLFAGRQAKLSCIVNLFTLGSNVVSLRDSFVFVSGDEANFSFNDSGLSDDVDEESKSNNVAYYDLSLAKPFIYPDRNFAYPSGSLGVPICGLVLVSYGDTTPIAYSYIALLFPMIMVHSAKPVGGSATSYNVEVTSHGLPFFVSGSSAVRMKEDDGDAPHFYDTFSEYDEFSSYAIYAGDEDSNFIVINPGVEGATNIRVKVPMKFGENFVLLMDYESIYDYKNNIMFYSGDEILDWVMPV